MTIVRVIKSGEWHAVIEVKPIFGSPKQLCAVLKQRGITATVGKNPETHQPEVHIEVSA